MDKILQEILTGVGAKDYDDLNSLEQEEYRKMLEVVESSKITLEDFRKHVKVMRQSVEAAFIDEPMYIYSLPFPWMKRVNPRFEQLRARMKNYLLFEAFFEKPDRARDMLEMYRKRIKK